jgi:hypothetical protein
VGESLKAEISIYNSEYESFPVEAECGRISVPNPQLTLGTT